MTPSFRRGLFLPCRVLALCGLSAAAVSLPGCNLIEGAEVAAKPAVMQKPAFPVFDPAEYVTAWPAKMVGTYRVTGVISGELLTIQGVNTVPKGKTTVLQYGVPETVRLAGIVAPAPGQPGWQYTVNKVNEWVGGKNDLEVEIDPKYPVDLENRRMVQIYFRPTPKGAAASAPGATTSGAPASGARWNLNRMLVHTGYAVVDLFGATSVNTQLWLNDEEFAKNFVDPKKPTIEVLDAATRQRVSVPNVKPLGLWGLGITVPQRGIPARGSGAIVVASGPTSAIGSTAPRTVRSSRATQTQQTTRTTTQNGASSTGTAATTPSGASTVPSTTTPSAASSTTASRSTTTNSVTTPSSTATSTTTSSTNSVSAR